jgi:DNA-binding transcriptional ArsR family regulator
MQSFSALADPTRRKIVDALAAGPLNANEVVELFPISQPSVSRHLRILREAGLVSVDQQGRRRVYRLDAQPLREIDDWLDRYRHFWADRLDALERHMDD